MAMRIDDRGTLADLTERSSIHSCVHSMFLYTSALEAWGPGIIFRASNLLTEIELLVGQGTIYHVPVDRVFEDEMRRGLRTMYYVVYTE